MTEALVILAIFVGGSLFARAAGVNCWILPAIGYVSGTAILISIGSIQIICGLPTGPIITLGLTVALPLIWWLSVRGRGEALYYTPLHAALALLIVTGLIYVFREAGFVSWHADSIRYLMNGALIASDNSGELSLDQLAKRMLGVPLIHSPANLAGEFYLRSAAPLLAISTTALIVWFCLQGLPPRIGRVRIVVLATVSALLLVSNNRFVWNAFLLNGHLLFAVLVLIIGGCGWLLATKSCNRDRMPEIHPRTLVALQAIALPALIFTRPEGALVAALAILPTTLHRSVAPKYKMLLVFVYGASVTAWNLFLFLAYLDQGGEQLPLPLSVIGPLALGLATIAVTPSLSLRLFEEHHSHFLALAEAMLWTALVIAALREPARLLESFDATVQNVLVGAGSWGNSLIILAALVGGLAILARATELVFLRFPVTAFIPLAFLLAYFREESYRVGNGDSLNRMWVHILPLAILFVIAAVGSEGWRFAGWWRQRQQGRVASARGSQGEVGPPANPFAILSPYKKTR